MNQVKEKIYHLNRDFDIRCRSYDNGKRTVEVLALGLPFESVLESSEVYTPERGNIEFKRLCQKYKDGLAWNLV